MSFTAEAKLSPDEVLALLRRRLDNERGDSWAKGAVLTSSTVSVYGRVEGSEFQASRHAGMSMFGAIASGSISATSGGTAIHVNFRFGIAPAAFPRVLFFTSLMVAAAGMAVVGSSPEALAAWALLPATAGLYWWHARWEVRFILEKIAQAADGLSWRESGS